MTTNTDDKDPHYLHQLIRFIAGLAARSFFTEIRVKGEENVPKYGPIIVTATHHNMILDPVILSVGFPYQRILNYWSKASLFAHPIMRRILISSGNIPVDRKSKDRQVLFKGTIEALSKGAAVALFPEGTSYTEPRIMQVKDGAAWAAMEYTRWKNEDPSRKDLPDVQIIPASIVYTNKSKYRSGVVMEFGRPISAADYQEQFFSNEEGAARAAVKSLTRAIERELVQTTINAPDWDTLYVARMARDILWDKEGSINLDDFVEVSQTLVDLFAKGEGIPSFKKAKRQLLAYYALLQSSHLTNSVLTSLPLPRTLDPKTSASVPSRVYTLLMLVRDSIAALVPLPFFLVPLVVHSPVYIMGRIAAGMVEDEEETQAQNKIAFGLLTLLTIYSATFVFLWALFRYTPLGALIAGSLVYLFAVYHIKIIDANYERLKRSIAAWRILVGVWVPKRWDLSLSAVTQYMSPRVPPPNPWIDRPVEPTPGVPSGASESEGDGEGPGTKKKTRRPPSRRLVRHVLRARVLAVNALGELFREVREGKGGGVVFGRGLSGIEMIRYLERHGGRIPLGVEYDSWGVSSETE